VVAAATLASNHNRGSVLRHMAAVRNTNTYEIAFGEKQLALKIRSRLLTACAIELAARVEGVLPRPATTAWPEPSLPFLFLG
jgi:hypothetical protein